MQAGSYLCKIEKKLDEDNVHVLSRTVDLILSLPEISYITKNQKRKVGQSVSFLCKSTFDSVKVLAWYHRKLDNSTVLLSKDRKIYNNVDRTRYSQIDGDTYNSYNSTLKVKI